MIRKNIIWIHNIPRNNSNGRYREIIAQLIGRDYYPSIQFNWYLPYGEYSFEAMYGGDIEMKGGRGVKKMRQVLNWFSDEIFDFKNVIDTLMSKGYEMGGPCVTGKAGWACLSDCFSKWNGGFPTYHTTSYEFVGDGQQMGACNVKDEKRAWALFKKEWGSSIRELKSKYELKDHGDARVNMTDGMDLILKLDAKWHYEISKRCI